MYVTFNKQIILFIYYITLIIILNNCKKNMDNSVFNWWVTSEAVYIYIYINIFLKQ